MKLSEMKRLEELQDERRYLKETLKDCKANAEIAAEDEQMRQDVDAALSLAYEELNDWEAVNSEEFKALKKMQMQS